MHVWRCKISSHVRYAKSIDGICGERHTRARIDGWKYIRKGRSPPIMPTLFRNSRDYGIVIIHLTPNHWCFFQPDGEGDSILRDTLKSWWMVELVLAISRVEECWIA